MSPISDLQTTTTENSMGRPAANLSRMGLSARAIALAILVSPAVGWSHPSHGLSRVSLVATLLHPSIASACRDCPFPMRLSAGRWLMPSGEAMLTIDEKSVGRGRVESVIRLVDMHSGAVLAEGSAQHNRGKMRVNASLTDTLGGTVLVELYYQDTDRKKVKVRMTCQTCTIKSQYYR